MVSVDYLPVRAIVGCSLLFCDSGWASLTEYFWPCLYFDSKKEYCLNTWLPSPFGPGSLVYHLSISISHALGLTMWFTCWGAGCIRRVRDTWGQFRQNPQKPHFWLWNGLFCPIVDTTASLQHCFHAWLFIPHLVHCPALLGCWRNSGFILLWAAAHSVCLVSLKLFPSAAGAFFSA